MFSIVCSKAIELEVNKNILYILRYLVINTFIMLVKLVALLILKIKKKIKPEDTIYIKPNVRHSFTKNQNY